MISQRMQIRPSRSDERGALMALTQSAFGAPAEAQLVGALIDEPLETPSFVAELDGELIGHVLYSQLTGPDKALALGPLSVRQQWRDMQVGTQLTRQTLSQLRDDGWQSVFVLGAPGYYERFGFKSELADRVRSQYQGPYLLAKELVPGALSNFDGAITYPKPFSELAP